MASNYTVRLNADTSKHNQALKQSANQVYQYSKRVDNAKKSLSNLAKKIPAIAGALGVTTGAMATFNKMVNQTQTATDAWGTVQEQVNASINTLANRISGVGFGDFITGLKEATAAARTTYQELDRLATMSIFQDKSTADYNYKKAQLEQVIKNKKSTKAEVDKAIAELRELNDRYVKEQEALAGQEVKSYKAMMQQLFANAGVKVTDGFIEKYLGSLSGYDQAVNDLNKVTKELEKHRQEVWEYNANGQKQFYGYKYDNNKETDNLRRRQTALQVVVQTGDDKLQQANQHYINARNIQTKLIEEQTKQNKYVNSAEDRYIKSGSSTSGSSKVDEVTTPNSVRWYNEQIKALTDEQEKLNLATIEGEDRYNEINAQVRELKENLALLTGQIEPATDELKEYKEWWEKNTEVTDEFFNNYLNGIANLRSQKYADVIEQFNGIADAVESVGSVFGALGDVIGESGNEWLNFTQKAVQGIGVVIEQAGKLVAVEQANAIASGVAQGAKEPFPANLVAISTILSTLLSIFASMPKFATGGIVGGTTVGDYNLARVNGGEMILNQREQRRLFSVLSSGATLTNDNSNNSVTFRVSGNDLIGVLNNYNNKRNRVR